MLLQPSTLLMHVMGGFKDVTDGAETGSDVVKEDLDATIFSGDVIGDKVDDVVFLCFIVLCLYGSGWLHVGSNKSG